MAKFPGISVGTDADASLKKVLLLHGIGHNCNAFKRLIREFKQSHRVVAIDLPGHGHSSHFPAGLPLQFFNYVLAVKRVAEHLNWERFYMIGHSFGGQLGTYFTALFGQHVEALLVVDTMEPRPVPLEETLPYMQSRLTNLLSLELKLEQKPRPTYTFEEAFKRVQTNTLWPLTVEATKDLMERSVEPVDQGFAFVVDPRLKNPLRPLLTFEQQLKALQSIVCPVLFALADQNMARYSTYLKPAFDFNRSRQNCHIVVVAGDHAVHQNHPRRIAAILESFLETKTMPASYTDLTGNQ